MVKSRSDRAVWRFAGMVQSPEVPTAHGRTQLAPRSREVAVDAAAPLYKSAFVTDRDAWNQLVFTREDHDLVQGYEWGESRRYAGFTPYRLAVRDGDEVGALSNILVARSPFGTLMYAPHGPVFAQLAAIGPLMDTIRELARETGAIYFVPALQLRRTHR